MKRIMAMLVATTAGAAVGAATSRERMVGGDALIAVTVNGKLLHLRAEPSAPGLPQIAPALAASLGLKGGGFLAVAVGYSIGRESVRGRTQVAMAGWDGGKPVKQRVTWVSRAYTPPADGTVGPSGLPESIIRFQLRAGQLGEHETMLPMPGGYGPFEGWAYLDAGLRVGTTPVRVHFDPYHARSLATAAAAIPIAAAQGGTMTQQTGRQEIAFGIERPYRVMKLARPLAVGGLSLATIGVRVTDGDIAGRIAEEGATPERVDPDEIVVTARGRKPRPGLLILGADALAGCSSIVFDKPARQIRLTCA